MSDDFHEGLALDAVLRRLEARSGLTRSNVRDPEQERHAHPIDLACNLGSELIALEHTGIEAFPGQLRSNAHVRALLDPIPSSLSGIAAPGECFQLMVHHDALDGLSNSDVPKVRAALTSWIRSTAPKLVATRYGDRHSLCWDEPAGVPFKVAFNRFSDAMAMGGRVYYVRVAPADVEAGRQTRFETMCEKKFDKLAAWKRGYGARTVLVLEDTDIALTSEPLVYSALVQAEQSKSNNPDEVYLLNATAEPDWYVTCLRRYGHTYLTDEAERFQPVAASALVALTNR